MAPRQRIPVVGGLVKVLTQGSDISAIRNTVNALVAANNAANTAVQQLQNPPAKPGTFSQPPSARVGIAPVSGSTNAFMDAGSAPAASPDILVQRGRRGEDGEEGRRGIIGGIGPPGPSGPDGGQGFPGRRGEEGDRGRIGPPGVGTRGATGATGAAGTNGLNGIRGRSGEDGESTRGRPGIASNGVNGVFGARGRRGEDGDDGRRGPAGVSASASTTGANPTAKVGLTVVNGSATTFMRSDGAPPIDQAISPTWTGNHTHTPTSGVAIVVNSASGQNGINVLSASGQLALVEIAGNGGTIGSTSLALGQLSSEVGVILNRANAALELGTNGVIYLNLAAAGQVSAYEPNYGLAALTNVATAHIAQTFTGTLTGCTTSPTATLGFSRTGDKVTVYALNNLLGTSNTATLSITGLPTEAIPANAQLAPCLTTNNGVASLESYAFISGGTITLVIGVTSLVNGLTQYSSSYTASGTKGVAVGWAITYTVN